jgi:DNA modification methylase
MNTEIRLVNDNLEILKELYSSGVNDISLIYIDPPFNKGRVMRSPVNECNFNDAWHEYSYESELNEIAQLSRGLSEVISFLKDRIPQDYVAYLTAIGIRCWYMRELLKNTGSFYFHCDDTMHAYIKIVLDNIFGVKNFKNIITWQRIKGKNGVTKNYPRNTDMILFYTKSNDYTFNPQYKELSSKKLASYRLVDKFGRQYLLAPTIDPHKGVKEWVIDGKVIRHPKGRGFRWSQETLDRKRKEHFEKYGTELIQISKSGIPYQVIYLDDSKGALVDNNWIDISCLQGSSKEYLGYPTQKPEALLERIILTSSNAGDKVADFYLGSGTTAAVALKNGRHFIGCDINPDAIRLTNERLSKIKI